MQFDQTSEKTKVDERPREALMIAESKLKSNRQDLMLGRLAQFSLDNQTQFESQHLFNIMASGKNEEGDAP